MIITFLNYPKKYFNGDDWVWLSDDHTAQIPGKNVITLPRTRIWVKEYSFKDLPSSSTFDVMQLIYSDLRVEVPAPFTFITIEQICKTLRIRVDESGGLTAAMYWYELELRD